MGTELAAIVGACDGELTLGAIVVAVAQLLDLDLAELRRATVAEARELLVDGVLQHRLRGITPWRGNAGGARLEP